MERMNRHERYNRSAKGRARYTRYRDTDKGRKNERLVIARQTYRRRAERIQEIEKELNHQVHGEV